MLLDFLRRRLISRPTAYARRLKRAWLAQLRAHARRQPLWSNTVVYESFGGNGALDNPEAIFRRLLERSDHATTKHIWALKPGTGRAFKREFRGNDRVRFVKYRSSAYFAAISRATYLVNNATWPTEFGKRPGQVYLNTWHGTPLKLMGYDMPDGAVKSANVMRNLLSADVLLSQSPWMTENMYNRGYKLDGFYRGSILELGYPRTDIHFTHTEDREALRAKLGVTSSDQQLIMYAPTWTGENFSDPRMEAEELVASVSSLQQLLGPQYVVRLKAHQLVHGLVRSHPEAAKVLVDNEIPTNAVLDVSDQLVTDFSSIFFDFLAVDRPISYLVLPDSNYLDERGTYIPQDQLPGPVLQSVPELADRIREPKDEWQKTRREWAERFLPHGDGKASDRAIDALFAPPTRQDPEPTGDRSRLLIYSGGMRSNGITSSLLNLLASLDHETWDVTLLSGWPRGQARRNHGHVDPRVRQLFRVGGMNGGKLSLLRFQLRERRQPDRVLSAGDSTIWREEISRLLADNHFDVALDFSGYSRFWTQVLLHLPAKRRAIWLHNDMSAEVFRPVNGKLRMKRTLPAVFQLYKHFDELVSVSPRLSELNRDNLAAKYGLQADHFTYARNMIDVKRIRTSSVAAINDLLEVQDEERDTSWLGRLDEPNTFWFITLGRLSPEKNQARLVAAFDLVHQKHPEARLLVVGDGSLMDDLKADVHRRGLDDVAILAGSFGNPFPLLRRGNCFVLSSNYEGQPMVLLEAATLGLPIVTTRFGSAEDALPPGTAIVTDLDAAALAEGMMQQLAKPLTYVFDPDAYNAMVLGETERVISSLEPSPHRHPHAANVPARDN